MVKSVIVPVAAVSGMIALLGLAPACGDDPDPAVSFGSSSSSSSSSGGDGTPADAGSDALNTEECSGLALSGEVVPEIALPADPPAPRGGTIAAGTYDLSQLYRAAATAGGDADSEYGTVPSAPTGRTARVTLVVTGERIARIAAEGDDDAGLGDPSVDVVSYVVDGTTLVTTSICPAAGVVVRMPFSAEGETLSFLADGTRFEVYSKR